MKILIVPDVLNWAIGHLAQAKVKYNPHHTFKIVPVHPRDAISLADEFEKVVKEFKPDIIHYEYFRSAAQLIEAKPFLKKYTSILTHHNQRDKALKYADWNELGIDRIVCHTNKTRLLLEDLGYDNVSAINHGVDQELFTYDKTIPKEKFVGYAGRICPWKGLKAISAASIKAGYPVMFMGKHDKPDYWAKFTEKEKDNINFSFMECSDEERLDYYRSLTCYVGFSDDNYEEGTMELLEAMACGVPIITTQSGIARDIIKDGYNGLLVDFGDEDGLEAAIKRLMVDEELQKTLKSNAWETVKIMTEQRMSYEYSKIYNQVYRPDYKLASVIVPTFNRKDSVLELLKGIKNQTHPKLETIIVDDGSTDGTLEAIIEFSKLNQSMTIKLLTTGKKDGYNLAMARNIGVIEAEGDTLIFIDSRLKPDENACLFLTESVDKASDVTFGGNKKVWFFGNKGANKKAFVENFSAVSREEFMKFGMFCERIDKYGGMSQEIRTRWTKQGGQTIYLENVLADVTVRADGKDKRRKDIAQMKMRLQKMYGGDRY